MPTVEFMDYINVAATMIQIMKKKDEERWLEAGRWEISYSVSQSECLRIIQVRGKVVQET